MLPPPISIGPQGKRRGYLLIINTTTRKVSSDKTSKSTKNRLKTMGKLSKNGIEPDDMVGPVGYEPTNIAGIMPLLQWSCV